MEVTVHWWLRFMNRVICIWQVLGRGIGQVMFQNSVWSGWLMLAGICIHSWQMGLLAIAGNMVSTSAAYFFGYERSAIKDGLYGFNGTLVGLAVGVFMKLSWETMLLLVAGSCLSTWIVRLFGLQRHVSGFTAPFILSVWAMIAFCTFCVPEWLLVSDTVAGTVQSISFVSAFSQSVGQVMFQGNGWTGLAFLVAILLNSRIGTFYAVLGSMLSIPLAMFLGVEADIMNMGLMGYNGVLGAMALGDRTWKGLREAVCAVILSVALQLLGMNAGIPTLTAPFVLSVWFTRAMFRFSRCPL